MHVNAHRGIAQRDTSRTGHSLHHLRGGVLCAKLCAKLAAGEGMLTSYAPPLEKRMMYTCRNTCTAVCEILRA